MNDQQGFGQRPMNKGQWTCSQCGSEITELPFEPDGNRPIFCRNCYRSKRQDNDRGPRKDF
ncbi:MAG: CxxC-x17-CxxC domain-containing protein [Patescibacteria group bacterium]